MHHELFMLEMILEGASISHSMIQPPILPSFPYICLSCGLHGMHREALKHVS